MLDIGNGVICFQIAIQFENPFRIAIFTANQTWLKFVKIGKDVILNNSLYLTQKNN